MVTLTNADNALKSLYLEALSNQLNTATNPLYNKFVSTERDVWGKEIIKLAPYGMNGGIGAGTESGSLPLSAGNNYKQFKQSLKNLYGTIEISDKAIRASENNAGAFLSLLDAEMDGLLAASKFNFGRMLFGKGDGVLASVAGAVQNEVEVTSVQYLMEGMVIDFLRGGELIAGFGARRVTAIDRAQKTVTISGAPLTEGEIAAGDKITMQGSYMNELTGLEAIFDGGVDTLYGLSKSENPWLKPYTEEVSEITEAEIQRVMDELESVSGSAADYIVCGYGVRRAFQNHLRAMSSNVDFMNLEGGFKALAYNGIPLVADRFCQKGTMYILSAKDFNLHQLCDWRWLEGENGRVLKQIAGKPSYTATLVKYADLICNRPNAQAKLTGITEA